VTRHARRFGAGFHPIQQEVAMSAIANTTVTLAAAVANGATVTVAYPAGTNQARLIGSTGGSAAINNDVYDQAPSGAGTVAFTFGASDITVTNNSGITWPIQSTLVLGFGDTTKSGSYNPSMKGSGPVALTAATGTASDTIADVGGSFSQTTLNNNFKSLADKLNALIAAVENAGITN
jgi:hypothetical protein